MVTDLDPQNKKVRIKAGLENQYDPYIFFKDPALQSEI